MTQPSPQQPQPQPQAQPLPQPPPPPEADTESLVPVVLGVIAAYMATKVVLRQPWTAVARQLKIMQLGGNVIEMIARRSVERMRRDARGNTGRDLIPHIEEAVQAATEAGVKALVDMLKAQPMPGQAIRLVPEMPGTSPSGGRRPVSVMPVMPVPVVPVPVDTHNEDGTVSRVPGTKNNLTDVEQALVDPDQDGEYELVPVKMEVMSPAHARRIGEDLALTITYTVMDTVAALAGWRKQWHSKQDPRVRRSHAALNGVKIPAKSSFRTIDKIEIRYPHDPKAPTSEIAGCRCSCTFGR